MLNGGVAKKQLHSCIRFNVFVLQVKQEADEVLCIKEEPEDEQELMVTLLDCQMQQPQLSESQVHLMSKNKSRACCLFVVHRLKYAATSL